MKARIAGSILLLFAALLVPAALAAGITIASGQTDYYFALGQTATISLSISNTYSHEVNGTLRFTTVEQLQNTGNVLTSTKNRVYPTTFPAGTSYLNLSADASTVSETLKVQVAYQYTDSTPIQVTVPELHIHFVQDPAQYANQQGSSVTSTSGAASSGGLGTSSVQIVQQPVSVQQQAGRDSGSSSQSSSSSPQSSQMFQDTSALKAQLQQAAAQKEEFQNEFNGKLAADPLLRQVNETLATDGFFRQSVTTNPTSGDNGTFSMTYQDGTGKQVNLQGAMSGGIVPSVVEQSFAAINVTAPLSANATYQSFSNELVSTGFQRNQTFMNVTLSGAMVNITYLSEEGMPAYVHATIDQENVTQVSLGMETETANYFISGLIAAIIAILAVCAWLIYRRLKAQKKMVPPVICPPRPAPVPPDHRKEALRLLAEAEATFAREEYQIAYGLAGRATRLFISYESGDRRELTNAELATVLAAFGTRMDSAAVMALLEQCSDVEFAKGMPDAGEFAGMIRQVRTLVTGSS